MALKKLKELTPIEKEIAKKVAASLKLNHMGQNLAISNSQMVSALKHVGIQVSDSVIRKIINFIRHKGYPVCSSSRGYWWAANKKELKECIDALEDRVQAQLATLNNLKDIYKKY